MENREISFEQITRLYHKANMSPVWGRMPVDRMSHRPTPNPSTPSPYPGCVRFPSVAQALPNNSAFVMGTHGHFPPITGRELKPICRNNYNDSMLPDAQRLQGNQSLQEQDTVSPRSNLHHYHPMLSSNVHLNQQPVMHNTNSHYFPDMVRFASQHKDTRFPESWPSGTPSMMVRPQKGLFARPNVPPCNKTDKARQGVLANVNGPRTIVSGHHMQKRYMLSDGNRLTSKPETTRKDLKPYSRLYGVQEDYTKLIRRDILKCIRSKMMAKQMNGESKVTTSPRMPIKSNIDPCKPKHEDVKTENTQVTPAKPDLPPSETSPDEKSPALSDLRDGAVYILCDVCSERGLFLCSGCHRVAYCSRRCQTTSWSAHKRLCKE